MNPDTYQTVRASRLRTYVSIVLFFLAILTPDDCTAHHFKGLPHFSYFENYPQVPQEEFLEQEGEFEFSLVIYDFQGIKREETQAPDDVRLFLVIYNLRENVVYNGPVTLKILDRGESIYTEKKASSVEESIYTIQRSLPVSGKYALGITLHGKQALETTIPFVLSSQRINWAKWVAGALCFLIFIVAIGSRRARILMDRKADMQMKKRVTD
jgi:hypothetical protein